MARLSGFEQVRRGVSFRNEIGGEGRTAVLSDYEALTNLFGLSQYNFRKVSSTEAFKIAIVYACTRLIAGAIAQLPIDIYRANEDGGKEEVQPELTKLLNVNPHTLFGGPTFWEWVVANILLHGHVPTRIIRGRNGKPTGLEPRLPDGVQIVLHNERLIYSMTHRRGSLDNSSGAFRSYDQDDILHFHGFGFNGVRAPSVIQSGASHGISLALTMEEHAQEFFDTGAHQQFAVMKQGNWTPEQRDTFREMWKDKYSGLSNRSVPIVLDKTASLQELSMKAEDAQLVQSREMEITDIARAFGLPSFMVNQEQKSTSWGTGVSEIGYVFLRYTIMPHLRRIEGELNRKLAVRKPWYIKFNVAALVRATMKERFAAYRQALGGSSGPGFYSVNDVRKLEELPPSEGEEYDKPFMPSQGLIKEETEEPEEDDDDPRQPPDEDDDPDDDPRRPPRRE